MCCGLYSDYTSVILCGTIFKYTFAHILSHSCRPGLFVFKSLLCPWNDTFYKEEICVLEVENFEIWKVINFQ